MPFPEFDYKAMGLRIKMIRIKRGLSQNQVAEKTGLTSPHISNVETGNTKVSLSTLVNIATILECSVDELLHDNIKFSQHVYKNQINELMGDCNDAEVRFIFDIVKATKQAIRLILNNSSN